VPTLQYFSSPFLLVQDSFLPELEALFGGSTMSLSSPVADRHEPVARKHDLLPVDEDPMARVCCNVLLCAYLAAEPLQWLRMVALVRCMSECVLSLSS
jgi:hypothetical protein